MSICLSVLAVMGYDYVKIHAGTGDAEKHDCLESGVIQQESKKLGHPVRILTFSRLQFQMQMRISDRVSNHFSGYCHSSPLPHRLSVSIQKDNTVCKLLTVHSFVGQIPSYCLGVKMSRYFKVPDASYQSVSNYHNGSCLRILK